MDTLTKRTATAAISRLPTKPLVRAKGFVELIGRSNFSFLQGASSPEEMVERAIELGYDGINICDLNGLYGVVRGFQTAQSPSLFKASTKAKEGFHYLIGSELTLIDETSIVLIPINKQGYSHLCEILTLGKRQAAKGFSKISLEQIQEYNQHLLCLAIPPCSDERYEKLESIFEDRLYLPVWRDLTWESQEFCRQAFHLEKKYEARLFVTQRPFMHDYSRKPLFDVVTCIMHHTTLEEAKDKLIQNGERYLRNLDDLSLLWQERLDLVEKTVDIAARVNFSLDEIRYRYPSSSLPPGMTPTEYLRYLTEEGAQRRYPQGVPDKVKKQIEYELELIKEMQFEDYFLTLKEICDFASAKQILHQGRGSAANSVVCYCIGLTAIDPVQMELLFERFISRERREPPDIDIDFEHSRREEVIQHIYERYNERHAAMVCTVIRYRSRMAIRETAKVFGVPLDKINAMVKFMGRDGMRRLLDTSVAAQFGLSASQWKMFLNLAQKLHGFPRHLGIHSGGFLITQDPITEMVPVEKATMNGRYVIQWNKDDVDFLRLMKIDILSLGMLTCLRKCFDLLKIHKSIDMNLASVPHNDKPTYEMISRAETVGVFQIESRAQMNTLPRMKPRNFYDLVIEIALIRPGPLQGGMVHPFLKLRNNPPKEVTYAHPRLEPILKKTLGIPIFQEQVMKMVVAVADFTPGEADELRRIMSSAWRRPATMSGIEQRLKNGFAANGISPEYTEQIYKTIEGFANYGFPESHSASFALLTYASCYLKCHHPDVFGCSLLNSQPMGFYAPRTIIAEMQRNGVTVHPLSVQESSHDYTLEEVPGKKLKALRVGLRSVFGLPVELAKRVEQTRHTDGPFLNLADFIRRTALPRSVLIKLAAAGAFECFNTQTRELIWELESLSLDQQSFLWGHPKEQCKLDREEEEPDPVPFESNWDRLRREYDTKGYSVEAHPLSILRSYLNTKSEHLRAQRFVPYCHANNLKDIKNRSKVRIAGFVSITQRPPTAKGMCFITLEDEFGFINIVITPEIYQRDRLTIYTRSLLEVHGQLEKNGSIINVRAERILPLG